MDLDISNVAIYNCKVCHLEKKYMKDKSIK